MYCSWPSPPFVHCNLDRLTSCLGKLKFLWKCSVVGVFFEASDFLIVNLADTVWFDRILWITKMKKNFNTESYDFSLYLPSKAMEENEILILESRG